MIPALPSNFTSMGVRLSKPRSCTSFCASRDIKNAQKSRAIGASFFGDAIRYIGTLSGVAAPFFSTGWFDTSSHEVTTLMPFFAPCQKWLTDNMPGALTPCGRSVFDVVGCPSCCLSAITLSSNPSTNTGNCTPFLSGQSAGDPEVIDIRLSVVIRLTSLFFSALICKLSQPITFERLTAVELVPKLAFNKFCSRSVTARRAIEKSALPSVISRIPSDVELKDIRNTAMACLYSGLLK